MAGTYVDTVFEELNAGVRGIYSTLGNAVDGATSILGDYLELEQLWKNEADQGGGLLGYSYWGQPTATNSTQAPLVSNSISNSNLLMYVGLGLVGVVGLSFLLGK